jgi:hypothetical protein
MPTLHWELILIAASPGLATALCYIILGKRRWGSWLWWWRIPR